MVDASLTVGGLLGVLLSAGFVYAEVGRFAAPQVAQSRFDERKEIFAYTAGLFAGVPAAVPMVFYLEALTNAALLAALIDLVLVVAAVESASWVLVRSKYFGRVPATTFYVLGLRAGSAGILILTVVARFAQSASLDPGGIAVALLQSLAILAALVTAGMLSLPSRILSGGTGSPWAGALYLAVSMGLVGTPMLFGTVLGLVGCSIALLGSLFLYQSRLRPLLRRVGVPAGTPETGPPLASERGFRRRT
ncbi:MAG TPA: hypothetical protein VJS68_01125 [Thermoplasmata archaeon]|nr:hypothetical protein [Thermoplasmata archaeon]